MHNQSKKLLTLAVCTALLVGTAMDILAMLPPKYLSIKSFEKCLATKNMGTWRTWCTPATRPTACPNESWQQLNNLSGKEKLPSCLASNK